MSQPEQANLTIRLFGQFDVQVQGKPLPPLRSRKGQWLLALLTLRAGSEVSREWLAGVLWADSEESQALYSLRRSLTDLRTALGEAADAIYAPTPRTLSLSRTNVWADVHAFDAALKRNDPAALEEAIALHRSPLLEGCFEDWAMPERESRLQAYLQALETVAQQARERNDLPLAMGLLRQVIATDPLRESAYGALMETLAAHGDHAEVTQTYRALRTTLLEELNAEPDAATKAVFARLRGAAKERAKQSVVSAPAPDSHAKPAPALGRFPRPLTRLIGRTKEIAEVENAFRASRLVTLTGAGGVGKTRLSLHLAERFADDYPDGVWFIDLAGLTEPAQIPSQLASIFEIKQATDRPLLEIVRDYLSERHALLIIDNCEHLRDACAQLTQDFLNACPNLRVLATSRQALGITGEIIWRVPSLSVPAAEGAPADFLLQAARVSDAATLFVERATAAVPTFALNSENVAGVLQICRRLDGIPLALELAAARVRTLTPDQIALRLKDHFRLLQHDGPVSSRQKTLRGLIDWSFNLLSESECLVFERLSVFAGGWRLEAGEQVCADQTLEDWEVLDLLDSLVQKSLVLFEAAEGQEPRYRFLEPIRQYAAERLGERRERDATAKRHRAHFLQYAQECSDGLRTNEQSLWVRRTRLERDNILAALENCLNDPEGGEDAVRLAGSVGRFWQMAGDLAEGRHWSRRAIEHGRNGSPSLGRIAAYSFLGNMSYMQGGFAEAKAAWAEGVSDSEALGDRLRASLLKSNLGSLLRSEGNLAEAMRLYEEAIAIQREEDEYTLNGTLTNMAEIVMRLGDLERSRALHEEALARWRRLGNEHGAAIVLNNWSQLDYRMGNYRDAQEKAVEALKVRQEINDRIGLCWSLEMFGKLAEAQGQSLRAALLRGVIEGQREAMNAPLLPVERAEFDQTMERLRAELGENVFQQARSEGRAMPMEQAIQFAQSAPATIDSASRA